MADPTEILLICFAQFVLRVGRRDRAAAGNEIVWQGDITWMLKGRFYKPAIGPKVARDGVSSNLTNAVLSRIGPKCGSPRQGKGDARSIRDKDGRGIKKAAISGPEWSPEKSGNRSAATGTIEAEVHSRAGTFEVRISTLSAEDSEASKTAKAKIRVTWTKSSTWTDWARLSEGCYALGTNLKESDPKVIWRR